MNRSGHRGRMGAIVVLAVMLMSGVFATREAMAEAVEFDIAAQPLAQALNRWAEQAGLQIIWPAGDPRGDGISHAVHGSFEPMQALQTLLDGTGLTYSVIAGGQTVAIQAQTRDVRTPSRAEDTAQAEGQLETARSTSASSASAGKSSSGLRDENGLQLEEIDEIVVTGTYIRGGTPVGSPLRIYSRADVDRSGAATVEQFARTMTENFSSMDMTANSNSTATAFGNPDPGGASSFNGAAFDLHGLGPTATLTLLNGNRVASAGFNGSITDISQIPLSAIERIEVLTDGSSAIYGADAIAGVVNIVTRTDFEGAETSVRYGGASEGGAAQLTASQLLGTAWNSGNVLFNYEYNSQDELDASDRDFIPDQGGMDSLMPENKVNSAFLAASQVIGSQTKLSGNAIYVERETSSHSHGENVFSISDSFNVSDVTQSGVSLRLERPVGDKWSVALAGNYSRVRQESTTRNSNTFDGDSTSEQEADTDLLGADVLVSGTVLQLATGPLKAAFGISSRKEDFENLTAISSAGFTSAIELKNLSRRAKSAYAELRVPVFGQPDSARQMEFSGAVRYDDYSDVGTTTNYKLGIGWGIVDGVRLRATYGTSYRAPLLTELGAATSYVAIPLPDPASPSGLTNTIIVQGGNPDLTPEESTSFSAGFDVQPAAIPHLSLGVTYFDVDFDDRIAIPPISGNPLTNPVAAPFVNRSPPLAEVQSLFALPGFLNFCCTGPDEIAAIFDPRLKNLAATKQSGVDFDATYEIPAASGQLAFTISATRLLKNDYQLIESLPSVGLLNTFARPPKWRGRGGIVWTRGALNASLSLNYVNSYQNGLGASPGNPGSQQRIDSWTTADLFVGYVAAEDVSLGALRGLAVGFAVGNITDEKPPFVEIPPEILLEGEKVIPFDAANASALGRYFSLQLTKRW